MNEHQYKDRLERMITEQLRERGIIEEKILAAFRANPRHLFVPESRKHEAYQDRPLPIGEGQTISQPYIVALMTKLLQLNPDDNVLELGTGSGFQSAILAVLADRVFSIEKNKNLLEKAKKVHKKLGLENIKYKHGDGTIGWAEHAPYEKIIGTGAVPKVPDHLIEQLSPGGKIVIPAGSRRQQRLLVVKKNEDGTVETQKNAYCAFLPLIGKEGW